MTKIWLRRLSSGFKVNQAEEPAQQRPEQTRAARGQPNVNLVRLQIASQFGEEYCLRICAAVHARLCEPDTATDEPFGKPRLILRVVPISEPD